MEETCAERGWRPGGYRYLVSLSELMKTEIGGVVEDKLNHNFDRRRSLGRWGTCTLDREWMDTKGGVPQPAPVKEEKVEKSVKGQTESPKVEGEGSVQRSVGKQNNIFLTFGANLKMTRGSVLKNRIMVSGQGCGETNFKRGPRRIKGGKA